MNQREAIINLAQKGWSEDQIEQDLKIKFVLHEYSKKTIQKYKDDNYAYKKKNEQLTKDLQKNEDEYTKLSIKNMELMYQNTKLQGDLFENLENND